MQIQYLEIVTKEVMQCAPHTHQQTGCSSANLTLGSVTREPLYWRAVGS